jgi:hypothetical protein
VRVRETVLPVLESELGPGIAAALARTAAQLREDAEAFDEMIDETIEDIVEHAEAGISVSAAALAANPAALRNRIIRHVVAAAPPTPSAPSPSAAEIASAIVAAILAIVAFATGNIGAGIGLLAAGVAIIDNATDPDWDELRCHLGWVDVYLQSLENALRDMLVAAGLARPFAVSLRHNPASFALAGVAEPLGAALNTCRPRADRGYPRSVWNPFAGGTFQSSWLAYPLEPTENPTTRAYIAGTWWPNHFLDGFTFTRVVAADGTVTYPSVQANPLGVDAGGRPFVLAADVWDEHRTIVSDGGSPDRTFGNATDIATALVQQGDGAWLDWDLDGDRGLSWPTWMHVPGGSPSAITPE